MKLETIQLLQNILLVSMLYLPIVTIGGFFEAWIATLFGDDVPKQSGYVTFDPWVHVSLWGYVFALITKIPMGTLVPLAPEVMVTVRKRYSWIALFFIRPVVHFITALIAGIALQGSFQATFLPTAAVSFMFNSETLVFTLYTVFSSFYVMNVFLTVVYTCLAFSRTLVFIVSDKLRISSFALLAVSLFSFFIFVVLFSPYLLLGVQSTIQTVSALIF